MPLYRYEGTTPEGEQKLGIIEAPSRMIGIVNLRRGGLHVRRLVEARGGRGPEGPLGPDKVRASLWYPLRPVPPGALADFYAQLGQLLRAGVSVHEAAHALQGRVHPRLGKVLEEVTPTLGAGEGLSPNLAQYPQIFPDHVRAMLQVGETSGNLDQLCTAISSQYDDEEWIRLRLKLPKIYYGIVLALALLVLTFPWMISRGFGWYLHQFLTILLPILVGIAVLIMAGKAVVARPTGKAVADDIICRLPFLAPFGLRAARARLLTCLHVLMRAGVDLTSALNLAAPAVGLRPMQVQLQIAAERIEEQEPVARALQDCGALSEREKAALSTAQQSGLYEEALERLATIAVEQRSAIKQTIATGAVVGPLAIVAIVAGAAIIIAWLNYYGALFDRIEEWMP